MGLTVGAYWRMSTSAMGCLFFQTLAVRARPDSRAGAAAVENFMVERYLEMGW